MNAPVNLRHFHDLRTIWLQFSLTSNETSLSMRPVGVLLVILDQTDGRLGTIGPLCDTPINSST